MMEEDKDVTLSTLSVDSPSIKVTEVVRDGDTLTFIIISQKLSGTGEYHVDRTYEDFEWLQHHLFSEEDVPGLQGVIFPPLPAKAQVNVSPKVIKQLGFLAMGQDWQPYCAALQTYLHQVAANSTLRKNRALEVFLTSLEPPGRQKVRKGIFNRLSQAVEGMRKEGHKDVDDFFQAERDRNLVLTGCTKTAAERFLDVVLSEQRIAVACGHFSTALQLCVDRGDDADQRAFNKICVKLSEVLDSMREMLFRRTCKLMELEAASKNAEKAKPGKKAAMEELKKGAEEEFEHISGVAKLEIARLHSMRVEMLRRALIQWCEKQLITARESADRYKQLLQDFKGMAV